MLYRNSAKCNLTPSNPPYTKAEIGQTRRRPSVHLCLHHNEHQRIMSSGSRCRLCSIITDALKAPSLNACIGSPWQSGVHGDSQATAVKVIPDVRYCPDLKRLIYLGPYDLLDLDTHLSTVPATMTLEEGTINPHINGNGSTNGATSKKLRIAVIPGDGIGNEVMVEGLRSLRAAAKR